MYKIISREIHIVRATSKTVSWKNLLLPSIASPATTNRKFSQSFWASVSSSTPVTTCQEWITQIHDISGMSWWGTIIVSTFLLRGVITFPLSLYQSKILAKVEKISEEMPDIVKELKGETAYAMKKYNWTEKQARLIYNSSLKKQWKNLIVRDNCHPAKASLLIWFQLPLWITQSWAIRNIIYMQPDPTSIKAQIACSEMIVGGFGWIPNLTDVDHSLILPVMLGLINLSIIEIQAMNRKVQVSSKFQKYTTNFFRILSVCMVPISAMVPSGLCLYWVSSSTFGLAQNLIVLSPKLKRLFGVPKTKSEIDEPYQFLYGKIRSRLGYKN